MKRSFKLATLKISILQFLGEHGFGLIVEFDFSLEKAGKSIPSGERKPWVEAKQLI